MQAIISDIHGNLEALTAVLERLRQLGVPQLICLGDVVAYGPDSAACLRLASGWSHVVVGDWDRALVNHDPNHWNPSANQQITRLRRTLAEEADGASLFATAVAFHDKYELDGCTYCHGTPRDCREFLFPEDIYCPQKLDRTAQDFNRTLFAGHTHVAGAFLSTDGSHWEYVEPNTAPQIDVTGYSKLICNVGSVGQPRDGDPRASFVLFDGRVIQFHPVDYDLAATIAKIKNDPDIDDMQGDRLPVGR